MNNFDKLADFITNTCRSTADCPFCGQAGLQNARQVGIRMFILGSGKDPCELRVRGQKVFDVEIRPGQIHYGMSGSCISSKDFIAEVQKFLEA